MAAKGVEGAGPVFVDTLQPDAGRGVLPPPVPAGDLSGAAGPEPPAPPRRHRLWIAGGIVVAGAVVGALLALSGLATTSAPFVAGGGTARAFELENVRKGQPPVSLAAYRGRPVVVNFWASWCVPCRREMPAFQAVAQKLKGRVAFVGVNHQDSRRAALELLDETGLAYPSGYDPTGSVAQAYGLFGMPTTLFISPAGRIVGRRTGEMSRKDLEQTIEQLFPARTGHAAAQGLVR